MDTWQSRITDLQSIGLTQKEIGEIVGLAVSTVSDIKNGRIDAPGGDAAVKLHALHLDRCRAQTGVQAA